MECSCHAGGDCVQRENLLAGGTACKEWQSKEEVGGCMNLPARYWARDAVQEGVGQVLH